MVGRRFEVEVGPVAHGGHFVARVPLVTDVETGAVEQRVVFVRHALAGERVTLEITEGTAGDRFWRGDAVEILVASADRVAPPCPFSGPGRCGGCDFQHVSLRGQRALKTAVVREQLARLAGIESDVEVEFVPLPSGGEDGLRWRTRQSYASPNRGSSASPGDSQVPRFEGERARGMRKYRSHEVIAVEDCLIARPDAREPVPGTVTESVTVGGVTHRFEVAGDGFWQVHPAAPTALVTEVLRLLDPRLGESVLDLYAGVGLFGAFLRDRVGPEAPITLIEGDRTASALSARNVPAAQVSAGDVATVLASSYPGRVDLVVLDPPREGARRAVVEQIVARSPRAVAYVACDPAALARDLGIFAEHGYELESLRAFDLFPMTHHVECVALLTKTGSDLR